MIVWAPFDAQWSTYGLNAYLFTSNYMHIARSRSLCRADFVAAIALQATPHARRYLNQSPKPFNIERSSNIEERTTMPFLYFVTHKDTPTKQGAPVLASAGRHPDECWSTLAANRNRMTGNTEMTSELQKAMTRRGFHVEKYEATPAPEGTTE